MDQAVYAEQLGFDSVWLSEHHFTDEGYLPCLPAVLGALAARTSAVRLGTAVPLAPLHHPLRLAEDLAVVDQLSEGRLDVGVAPGYKPEEFATLGVPKGERGARTDETIEILKRSPSVTSTPPRRPRLPRACPAPRASGCGSTSPTGPASTRRSASWRTGSARSASWSTTPGCLTWRRFSRSPTRTGTG
jgi:alkanesulfonate monooxygenase SsuD/methylene tetrahydromethanopterin reductase-like flavin-dependent oxidoreductase (luciferase family)